MRIFELGHRGGLPKRAGKAMLDYAESTENSVPPFRDRKTIVLPMDPEAEFFPFGREGEQFLLRHTVRLHSEPETRLWFGGTDEEPFLVRLTSDAFKAFQKEGQVGLYRTLIPPIILQVARDFSLEAMRQGDIFALPIPYTWDDISRAARIVGKVNGRVSTIIDPGLLTAKGDRVFGTRHLFTGVYAAHVQIFGGNHLLASAGVLEAPDHASRRLDNRVYLLGQTEHLWDSQGAD